MGLDRRTSRDNSRGMQTPDHILTYLDHCAQTRGHELNMVEVRHALMVLADEQHQALEEYARVAEAQAALLSGARGLLSHIQAGTRLTPEQSQTLAGQIDAVAARHEALKKLTA